jgi:phosphoribosylformylglycinamidine synthase
MAVVLRACDLDEFIAESNKENLIAVKVAEITDDNTLSMYHRGNVICSLKREFLDTNGVRQTAKAAVIDAKNSYMNLVPGEIKDKLAEGDYKSAILKTLSDLNVCSQRGIIEMFDSTVGAATVLSPLGGKKQLTESLVMAAKPPVDGTTDTATVCSFGFSPTLMSDSPFTGALYSVVTSVSKLIAAGTPFDTVYLTLQEYFKRLKDDPKRWGEPVAALLGALYAEINLGIGAIGGKDSMSGTFENIDVPPTLISFAVGVYKASKIIGNVFKVNGGDIYLLPIKRDGYNIPDFDYLKEMYAKVQSAIDKGLVTSATVVEEGGAIAAMIKSAIGNDVGLDVELTEELFKPYFGDIIVQCKDISAFDGLSITKISVINNTPSLNVTTNVGAAVGSPNAPLQPTKINNEELIAAYTGTLESIFPTSGGQTPPLHDTDPQCTSIYQLPFTRLKPKVLIPVFPGTFGEYDMAKAFKRAGADTELFVFRNQNANDIAKSIKELSELLKGANILALAGGASNGDEPMGSGAFISTVFNNGHAKDALSELLAKDGLIFGVGAGFNALLKIGLLADGCTLTGNDTASHISTMVRLKVASNMSPWMSSFKTGDIFTLPVSHAQGTFVADDAVIKQLIENGQVTTQYADYLNCPTYAIEGITSKDGRVFGRMAHAERYADNLYKNIEGNFDMDVFSNGVRYFQ